MSRSNTCCSRKTFYYGIDDLKHGEADLGDVVASRAKIFFATKGLHGTTGSMESVLELSIMVLMGEARMVAAALAFKPQAFDVPASIFLVSLIGGERWNLYDALVGCV